MAKQPGQYGQNAIWDAGLPKEGRTLIKGNSRCGDSCIQVLKAPTPYSPGPVTTKTYKSQMSQSVSGLSSSK